jgi:hypothetical protein
MAPLEELDDSTKGLVGWHKAGFVVKLFDPYYTSRVYIYTLVLIRLLIDYEYNI